MTKVDYMVPTPDEAPASLAGPRWLGWAALALLAAGLIVLFSRVLAKMWLGWFPAWRFADLGLYARLTEGDSYYTHGPLILAVSILMAVVLVLRTRIETNRQPGRGMALTAACMGAYLAGSILDTNLVRAYAFIGLLAGIVVAFWGFAAMRRLWFPIAFLFFMIPQQMWLISDVNLELKLQATKWAVRIAGALGIVAEQSGAQILLAGNQTLVVGSACSGLRSLVTLVAFGAAYAYVCRLHGWWRVGLFLMSVPIAIVSNCLRIVSIIVVARIWGVEVATGAYHDSSGLVVFVSALLMMFGLEQAVVTARKWSGKPVSRSAILLEIGRGLPDGEQWRRMAVAVRGPKAWAIGILGILLGASAWWLDRPAYSSWTSDVASRALPPQLAVGGKTLDSRNVELSDGTLAILETRDYAYRTYSGLGEPVDICVVFSKNNPTSTHPPEVCLGAMGGEVLLSRDMELTGVEGIGTVGCRELEIRKGQQITYYVYTFKSGSTYTARFGWQQILLFLGTRLSGNASGALIRVSTPVSGDPDESKKRAVDLLRAALPHLHTALK